MKRTRDNNAKATTTTKAVAAETTTTRSSATNEEESHPSLKANQEKYRNVVSAESQTPGGRNYVLDEVVISCGKEDTFMYLWELRSGVVLGSYKNNTSGANSLGVVVDDCLISAQLNQPSINIWTWRRDQPQTKCPMAEKLTSLTVTHDGVYCIAGGLSGRIYIWEVSGGYLLKIIDGHYKKINCLKVTTDDVFFVTAGDDSLVKLWSLYEVLSSETTPKPEKTWTSHTLPITDLYIGSGGYAARIFSCSIDRTCRIWNATSNDPVGVMVFPSAISSIVCDASERFIFAGGVDGSIYQARIVQAEASVQSFGLSGSEEDDDSKKKSAFKGHSKQVNALRASLDGQSLISASDDGTVKVWHMTSGQLIRTVSNHKGAVTGLHVMLKPRELANETEKRTGAPPRSLRKHKATTDDLSTVLARCDSIESGETTEDAFLKSLLSPYKADPSQLPSIDELSLVRRQIQSHLDHLSMSDTQAGTQAQIKQFKLHIESLENTIQQWQVVSNTLYHQQVDGLMETTGIKKK